MVEQRDLSAVELEATLRDVIGLPGELQAESARHRSPLVWRAVEDFLSGRRFPLQALTHFA